MQNQQDDSKYKIQPTSTPLKDSIPKCMDDHIVPDVSKIVRMILAGPSNCGKSTLVINLISRFWKKLDGSPYFDYVFVFSKTIGKDESYNDIIKRGFIKREHIYDTIDEDVLTKIWEFRKEEVENAKSYDKIKTVLLLFDDILTDSSINSKIVSEIFFSGRHMLLNTIWSVQKWNGGLPYRNRESASHVVLYRPRGMKSCEVIAEELSENGKKKEFIKMYMHAVKDPYSFFYIKNNEQDQSNKYFKNMDIRLNINK